METRLIRLEERQADIKADVGEMKGAVRELRADLTVAMGLLRTDLQAQFKEALTGLRGTVTWVQVTMVGLLVAITLAAMLLAANLAFGR